MSIGLVFAAFAAFAAFAGCGEDREPGKPFLGAAGQDMGQTAEDSGQTTEDLGQRNEDSAHVADLGEAPRCDPADVPCELTCEVLLDPAFCWNVGVAEAYGCMGDTATGAMAADGLTCGDGDWSVAFGAPMIEGTVIDLDIWDFEATRGGVSCSEFEDIGDDMTLSTANSKTFVTVDNDTQFYAITCGDTDTWETTDPLSLLSCQNEDGLTNLPGRGVTVIGAEWSFQLLPESSPLFSCQF